MSGFILYWRDKVTEKPSPLTYNNKKTLLYLYLAASAEFCGDNRGTLKTSIKHLSEVMNESYFTTRNWMIQLQKDALISFQRCFKNLFLVTICNYDELSGVEKGALKMFSRSFKDRNNTLNDSSELQLLNNKRINNSLRKEKEKEKINKKEKENAAAKAAAAASNRKNSRKTSINDVESELNGEFLVFAQTLGLDSDDIRIEFDKWMDWQDSKGKRFTDNKMAFKNWLRNAAKFRKSFTPVTFNTDNIPRLN